MKKHTSDKIADTQMTERKRLHTRMAVKAGKMIRLEISIAPINRIPSTTVTAVRAASRRLYSPVGTPVARAKVSSNVTENSLW